MSTALPPDLAALHSSFHRSSHEIESYQLPRLQSCTTAGQLADYAHELNASLSGLQRILVQLELAVDDAESSAERTAVSHAVDHTKTSMEAIRQATRKALVAARRNVESARTEAAREGLQLAAESAKERTGGRGGGTSGEDKLMTTSQDVTDALRRTVTLMSSELEKSTLSSSLLDESSQTLTALSSQYASLSTLMTNSAHLIRTMEREDLVGKGMLAASMLFFLTCVGYILYVRIVSRGFGLVAFFWRLLGLGRLWGGGGGGSGGTGSRSVEEVQEKLRLVTQVASTAMTAAATSGIAGAASRAAQVVTTTATAAEPLEMVPAVVDVQGELDPQGQLLESVVPADLFDGEPSTLTRQMSRPTERVEL